MENRRVMLSTFYFDVCVDYNLYRFLPHCAMALWECAQHITPPVSNRTLDASCFLVAQKMVDTSVFKVADISDIFSANENEVRQFESKVFTSSIAILTGLRPDRALFEHLRGMNSELHEHTKTFFNMSLIGEFALLHDGLFPPLSRSFGFCCHCAVASEEDLSARISASELAAHRLMVASSTPMVSIPSSAVDALAAKLLSYSRDGLGVRLSALAAS